MTLKLNYEGDIEMKKRISIIICVILAIAILAACANTDYATNETRGESTADSSPMRRSQLAASIEPMAPSATPMPMAEMMIAEEYAYAVYDDADWGMADANYSTAGGGVGGLSTSGIVPIAEPDAGSMAEKIIYYVHASIETLKFDETIADVSVMLATYNAFIENSSVSGVDTQSRHHGWNTHRSAHFTIRVPNQQLNAMTDNLDKLGNVTHLNYNSTNITTQFFDTQSRLNSLKVQEERLLAMLSRAEDVPELIMIEERLSDVRYQIEMLTTTLTGWQREVDFSTLSINIREVEIYTEPPELHVPYWQQVANGFMNSIRNIGRFFMNLFMWLIVSAPVIIIIAVAALVGALLIRAKIRKNKKAAAKAQEELQEQTQEVASNPENQQSDNNE